MQVVSWRVRVCGPTPEPWTASTQPGPGGEPLKGERPVYFPELGGFVATRVYDRYRLTPATTLEGPAVIEERESTVIIGPAARGHVDHLLNLIVQVRG
jgi:N-methylhydantoinase A